MSNVPKLRNFINGRFVPPVSMKYIDNFNPSNDELISLVPRSGRIDATSAVHAAQTAQVKWAALDRHDRYNWLIKLSNIIEKNINELVRLESLDMGKPFMLAQGDIGATVKMLRFAAAQAITQQTEARESNTHLSYTQRLPLGVCVSITPWNFPFFLLITKLAPCIAFGNTIICKPSEITPNTANYFATLLQKIDFPKGVINIVHGYGPEIGQPLIENPTVSAVSFTGGTVTGRIVTQLCGKLLKKVHCELGGKNPTIIFEDADLDANMQTIVFSTFMNSGQVCIAGSRIFVQESIFNKFLAKFVGFVKESFSKTCTMDPLNENCLMGPLNSKQHYKKVLKYLEQAKKDGGKIHLGGGIPTNYVNSNCRNGYFIMPTIITGLNPKSRCMQEEIFGPVSLITTFKDEKEALALANDVSYGLYGSVYTQDIQRAFRVSRQVMSGTVCINDWAPSDERQPFGGLKNSGFGGEEGGKHNIEFWTQNKNITCKL